VARVSGERLLAVLRAPEFWRCYVYDYDAVDVDAEGERLAGQAGDTVVLDLPAQETWRLRLEMSVDLGMYDLYLGTTDPRRRDQKYELGDWDQVCWHPWCLRWEEVEAVVRRMREDPAAQPVPPELARLLLARFVGHGPGEADLLAARRHVVADEFARLGMFTGAEAERMAERILITAREDDYAWRRCPEHGWVFGGADTAYSLRNHEHDFPFAEFAEFRGLLGLANLG